MLRNPNSGWLRRFRAPSPVPVRIADASVSRRCPDCSERYDLRDRYCPRCHTATPEWRYG